MATFELNNPLSGSSYFFIETKRNSSGFYDSSIPTYTVGEFNNFISASQDTLVSSSYIFGVVIPPGNSSFEFSPSIAIPTGSVYLRATGEITLDLNGEIVTGDQLRDGGYLLGFVIPGSGSVGGVFPNWEDNNIEGSVFLSALVSQTSTSTFDTNVATSNFRSISGFSSQAYVGGILAPNSYIYAAPFAAAYLLKIDPNTNNWSTFGDLSITGINSFKYNGGVLAPDGKIYFIPAYGDRLIIELNPETDEFVTLGSSFGGGAENWGGGVLAPNGKIYGIPYFNPQVLEIDPINKTTSLFGSLSGSSKWSGGVLAPNGKIYGIPFNATQVLEIDPINKTTSLFGSLSGVDKWSGGVLAPNGKIYGIPFRSEQILEIDPTNRTASTFGSVPYGLSKWSGGALAPNGKIYSFPRGNFPLGILEINPTDNTVNELPALKNGYNGTVLALNGKIYGIPFNAGDLYRIGEDNPQPEDMVLSRYLNKY